MHVFAAFKNHGLDAKLYQAERGKESSRSGSNHNGHGCICHGAILSVLVFFGHLLAGKVNVRRNVYHYVSLACIDASLSYA